MFLAGTAVTVYSVYQVVADYLSYPVITYVSMSHARKMTFPAVTVCNSNPINCYKLAQLRDLLPELWNISGCKIETLGLMPVSWLQSSDFKEEELKNGLDRYFHHFTWHHLSLKMKLKHVRNSSKGGNILTKYVLVEGTLFKLEMQRKPSWFCVLPRDIYRRRSVAA